MPIDKVNIMHQLLLSSRVIYCEHIAYIGSPTSSLFAMKIQRSPNRDVVEHKWKMAEYYG